MLCLSRRSIGGWAGSRGAILGEEPIWQATIRKGRDDLRIQQNSSGVAVLPDQVCGRGSFLQRSVDFPCPCQELGFVPSLHGSLDESVNLILPRGVIQFIDQFFFDPGIDTDTVNGSGRHDFVFTSQIYVLRIREDIVYIRRVMGTAGLPYPPHLSRSASCRISHMWYCPSAVGVPAWQKTNFDPKRGKTARA